MNAEIEALSAALPRMSASSRTFAASLIAQSIAKGSLSDKQMHWVRKLAAEATQAATTIAQPATVTADLSPIIALFDKANGPRSKIVFSTPEGVGFRLTVAGPDTRAPGTLNITSAGTWESREWFGRIHRDGRFEPSRKLTDGAPVVSALTCFAADPAAQAAAYGHDHGVCCFCEAELSDAISIELGYGPVCAKRWGLPRKPAKAE